MEVGHYYLAFPFGLSLQESLFVCFILSQSHPNNKLMMALCSLLARLILCLQ
jgi:hypothetical protein